MRRVVLALVALGLSSQRARAEVIGPILPAGTFEIALQDRYVERTQEFSTGEATLDQRDLALVVRWAVTEFATVSFEGMTGTNSFVSGYDDLEQFYLVGGGLQSVLWRGERVLVTGGLEYTETYRRWKDPDECDRATYALCWQILAQTDAHIAGQALTTFAGPVYSEEDQYILEGTACFRTEMHSKQNWGGVLGVVLLVAGHVTFNGQVFWVENPQPRFGIGYRF